MKNCMEGKLLRLASVSCANSSNFYAGELKGSDQYPNIYINLIRVIYEML